MSESRDKCDRAKTSQSAAARVGFSKCSMQRDLNLRTDDINPPKRTFFNRSYTYDGEATGTGKSEVVRISSLETRDIITGGRRRVYPRQGAAVINSPDLVILRGRVFR